MKKINYTKLYEELAKKAEKNFRPKEAKRYRLLSLAYAKLGKQAKTGGAKKLKPSRLFFQQIVTCALAFSGMSLRFSVLKHTTLQVLNPSLTLTK